MTKLIYKAEDQTADCCNYGRVVLDDGREIRLAGNAEPTSRLLEGSYVNYQDRADNGGTYDAEWVANGVDADDNAVTVHWIHEMTDETDPESLDWDVIDRVVDC